MSCVTAGDGYFDSCSHRLGVEASSVGWYATQAGGPTKDDGTGNGNCMKAE